MSTRAVTAERRCPPEGNRYPRFGPFVLPNGAAEWPVDLHYADRALWLAARNGRDMSPCNRVWLRTPGYPRHLRGADAAALTFATDLPMFEPVFFPTDLAWEDVVSSTALLAPRRPQPVVPSSGADRRVVAVGSALTGRARLASFVRGDVRTRAGALVVSVAQEVAFIAPRPR